MCSKAKAKIGLFPHGQLEKLGYVGANRADPQRLSDRGVKVSFFSRVCSKATLTSKTTMMTKAMTMTMKMTMRTTMMRTFLTVAMMNGRTLASNLHQACADVSVKTI